MTIPRSIILFALACWFAAGDFACAADYPAGEHAHDGRCE